MLVFSAETSGRDPLGAGIDMAGELEILNLLRRHNLQFVVVGGHAVNLHGYMRATEDLDVVWFRTPGAERGLLEALVELDATYIGKEIDPATGIERAYPVTLQFIQAHHLMMLWTKFGFLDLFDYIPGFPQEDVRQLLETSVVSNGAQYVSLSWLRRMKQAAGRTKDEIDLEKLSE
jgi:hypothetical protein